MPRLERQAPAQGFPPLQSNEHLGTAETDPALRNFDHPPAASLAQRAGQGDADINGTGGHGSPLQPPPKLQPQGFVVSQPLTGPAPMTEGQEVRAGGRLRTPALGI